MKSFSFFAAASAIGLLFSNIAMATIISPGDKVYVFTDLEPDDNIMLLLLKKLGIMPTAFIVGAGTKIPMKVKRARIMGMRIFKTQNIEVYGGVPNYVPFENEEVVEGIRLDPQDETNYKSVYDSDVLYNLFGSTENMIHLISVQPMTELFNIWLNNRKIFKNVRAYSYLSFNARSLITPDSSISKKMKVEEFINTAFGQGHIAFETSLLMGDANTCNIQNARTFWEKAFQSRDINIKRLLIHIEAWNTCTLDEMTKGIVAEGYSESTVKRFQQAASKKYKTEIEKLPVSVQRRLKVIDSINSGGLKTEFVFADPLVALYLGGSFNQNFDKVPKYLKFDANNNIIYKDRLAREGTVNTVEIVQLKYALKSHNFNVLRYCIQQMEDLLFPRRNI